MRAWSVLPLVLLLSACGGDGGGDPGDGGPGDAYVPPEGSFTVTFGPYTVQPGQESTRCVTKRVGNDAALQVGEITNTISSSSHHLIVYRVNDTAEQTEPYGCQPFQDTLDPAKGAPLMVTQKALDTLTLPDGVAFTLQPGQLVRLEVHYLNSTDAPVEITTTTTFVPAKGTVEHEADFVFVGNVDIDLPPMSGEVTVGPAWFPMPSVLAGANFFGITGHTHRFGKDVWVATRPSASGDITPVYDVAPFLWDEPETVMHDPPFTIPSGGGFYFTCKYDNTSTEQVTFGESANQEMCFFWTYYYPSQGAKACFHTSESGYGTHNICCPGHILCSQVGF
jgi:hypothetical protein